MAKFKHKTQFIDAVQFKGLKNPLWLPPEIAALFDGASNLSDVFRDVDYMALTTKQGHLPVRPGDWIIKNEKGEIEVATAENFAEKFETADLDANVQKS